MCISFQAVLLTRYRQGLLFSSICSTLSSLCMTIAYQQQSAVPVPTKLAAVTVTLFSSASLDNVVALAQHLQQRYLAERCGRHALLLHLRGIMGDSDSVAAGVLPRPLTRASKRQTSSRVFLSATSLPVLISLAL